MEIPGDRRPPRLEARTIQVGGRRAVVGLAEGGGETVLFVHGWGLSHRGYSSAITELAGHGYRVIAPDLPGFGGSRDLPFGEVSYGRFAAFLDRVLHELGVDSPVDIVGHSFGGGVSTRFARDHPDRVRHLVLVDAVSGALRRGIGPGFPTWAFHIVAELPVTGTPKAMSRIVGDAVVNLLLHPVSLGSVAHMIRSSDLGRDLAELAARGVPVTVLWGDKDHVVPRVSFEDLCRVVGVSGTVVPGAHWWLIAEPRRFADTVAAALE
jgi:pimeloyl-ACP methyl ester carboxylesterase